MDEYRIARRVLMAEVSGERVGGRPRLGSMDSVKVALGNRGMKVEAALQCVKTRKSGEPWYTCNHCLKNNTRLTRLCDPTKKKSLR